MAEVMYGWAVHGMKPPEEPVVVEEVVQPKPGIDFRLLHCVSKKPTNFETI